MHLLYTDESISNFLPQGSINVVYKRNNSLKEMLSPSLYPVKRITRTSSIVSCNNCDICKHYLVVCNSFKCSVTNKKYYIKGDLHCNSTNVVYLITCKHCLEQYVGSATNFKNRFRVTKVISKPIKTDVDQLDTLMVSANLVTLFSSCQFKLLNRYLVTPRILKISCGIGKSIGRANCLPPPTEWTAQAISIVTNVRVIGNDLSDVFLI